MRVTATGRVVESGPKNQLSRMFIKSESHAQALSRPEGHASGLMSSEALLCVQVGEVYMIVRCPPARRPQGASLALPVAGSAAEQAKLVLPLALAVPVFLLTQATPVGFQGGGHSGWQPGTGTGSQRPAAAAGLPVGPGHWHWHV